MLLRHYVVKSCSWRVECQSWWFNEESFVGNCNSNRNMNTDSEATTAIHFYNHWFLVEHKWMELHVSCTSEEHINNINRVICISSPSQVRNFRNGLYKETYCNNASQWYLFYIYAPATWSTLQILFWWSLKSSPIISTGRWNVAVHSVGVVWWLVGGYLIFHLTFMTPDNNSKVNSCLRKARIEATFGQLDIIKLSSCIQKDKWK